MELARDDTRLGEVLAGDVAPTRESCLPQADRKSSLLQEVRLRPEAPQRA